MLRSFIYSSRWIRIIEVLLLLALFALLARWITVLFAGAPLPVPPAISNTAAPRSTLAAEMLTTARLFGSHPAGTLSENVQIIGLIADQSHSTAGQKGSVLISIDGGSAKVYTIGSDVGGRRLVAIRSGEVEMEANGVRQSFNLPVLPAISGIVTSSP